IQSAAQQNDLGFFQEVADAINTGSFTIAQLFARIGMDSPDAMTLLNEPAFLNELSPANFALLTQELVEHGQIELAQTLTEGIAVSLFEQAWDGQGFSNAVYFGGQVLSFAQL